MNKKNDAKNKNNINNEGGILKKNAWLENRVQFVRLLAEVRATQDIDLAALSESMDLPIEKINELFERAERSWEDIKSELN
jgi:hypothetical protein